MLRAGKISEIMSADVVINGLNPQEILRYFEPDDNSKIIAAEVIGLQKENPFDLIVMADTDFLYDTFWGEKKSFLESEYVVESFDNANFVLNALDYLTNDDDLLHLRGKSAQSHPFSGIEKMRRLNSLEFTKQEDAIFAEMNKSKQAMQEVWNKKDFEERENFTADELAAVAKVREQLNELRQQLSDIREQAFADIRRIDNTVSLLNLLAVPVLLVLLLLGLKFRQALKQ